MTCGRAVPTKLIHCPSADPATLVGALNLRKTESDARRSRMKYPASPTVGRLFYSAISVSIRTVS